jgi:chemotaxis protein CheC
VNEPIPSGTGGACEIHPWLELRSAQLDALREIANIGAGHAATALYRLTGQGIMISVPRVKLVHGAALRAALASGPAVFAAVPMQLQGDLTGRSLLLLPRRTAHLIGDLLSGNRGAAGGDLTPLMQSGLRETANILASAYLNAIATLLDLTLLPSVPDLLLEPTTQNVIDAALARDGDGSAVAFRVETRFHFSTQPDESAVDFYLFPEAASVHRVLAAADAFAARHGSAPDAGARVVPPGQPATGSAAGRPCGAGAPAAGRPASGEPCPPPPLTST